LLAAGLGDEEGLAGELGGVFGFGPEEDAAVAGPEKLDGEVVLKDGWGVGEEGAVPEVGGAAVEDVEGGVGLDAGAGGGVDVGGALEVKGEGASGFVLSVDDEDVGEAGAGGFELGFEGGGEWLGGEDGGKGA